MTYDDWRERLAQALERAASAQDIGDVDAIEEGYAEIDGLLPRAGGPEYVKLHIALSFWDGWIDSRNHDWMYYDDIGDWRHLARGIASDLRSDREIQDESVLARFDSRRRDLQPGLWRRVLAKLRNVRAVEQGDEAERRR